MFKLLNFIAHIIDVACVMWKYDGAYIVITKDRNTGLFHVEERGTVRDLNRNLQKTPPNRTQE